MTTDYKSKWKLGGPAVRRLRERRRTVGRVRHYRCSGCGFERCSWVDLRSCPSCGTGPLQATVIRAVLR